MTGPQSGKVLVVAIIAVAFVVVAYLLFRPAQKTVIEQCGEAVLKGTYQGGASLLPGKGNLPTIQVGALKTSEGVASENQRIAFMACIRDKNIAVVDTRLITPALPLGQLISTFTAQPGMKVRLMPLDAPSTLLNLRVDAFEGERYQFIRRLCSAEGQGRCVTCEPSEITPSTVEVEVRLKEGALLKKEMFEKVPAPYKNKQLEPYQLVDENGGRFWYRCQ